LVHGGILATLVDIAMGLAVRTAVGPTRRHVTIDLHAQYLRPARPGRLEAIGSVVRVGTHVGFAEGSVMDAAGRLLVRASGTYSVTEDHAIAEEAPA
ncbi:MAG TPA: PaaI family thioesterase, partial [Actinomycetota bacterium]